MYRTILKSNIHRNVVTDANLNYEGSLSFDPKLMAEADILPYEKLYVVNINNGHDLQPMQSKEKKIPVRLN